MSAGAKTLLEIVKRQIEEEAEVLAHDGPLVVSLDKNGYLRLCLVHDGVDPEEAIRVLEEELQW